MVFHDREWEMNLLRNALDRSFCFVVLTGRRRIGKTRLVREALSGRDHVELFIPRKRIPLVLDQLKGSVLEQTGFSPSFRNLREVFEYILLKERKILFIDEISNLYKVDPGSFSDLQEIFDANKEKMNLHIIVDGSYVGVMKRIFQDRRQPLFGRATEILELGPLPVGYSVMMAMDYGFEFEDALEAASMIGGVPRYLELLEGYTGINDLKSRMFSSGSIFLTEGENLLIQEFGASWDTYFSILEVISRGRPGPSAIANDLDMSVSMVPKYLKRLERMKLIQNEPSVLGKKKQVGYRIADPFLELWFGVCYPKLELYKDGTAKVSGEQMYTAIGRSMERLVRDLLKGPGMLPFDPDMIGRWWNRIGDEIDIVAYSRKEKAILAGEVKWTNQEVGPDTVKGLLNKMDMIEWSKGKRREYRFIVSRSGFNDKARSILVSENILGIDVQLIESLIMKEGKIDWTRGSKH